MRLPSVNRRCGEEKYSWPWPALPAGAVVLLVGSFLYVWLRVEPVLEYHRCGPYFYRHWVFAETFLGRPGGPASYAGVFLAQLNCLNWLGALVFVLSEGLVFLAARSCLTRLSRKHSLEIEQEITETTENGISEGERSAPGTVTARWPSSPAQGFARSPHSTSVSSVASREFNECLRLSGWAPGLVAQVPVFVLLLLRNGYGCPVPALSIGLLLALAAAAAYLSLPWRRPWLSAVVSGLISGLLFFLAGLWSALLFAVLCCWFVVIQMRHWPAGPMCLVLACAAPLVAVGTGNLEMARLMNPWPTGVSWVLAAALYASVPVAGVVLALLPKPAGTPPANPPPVPPEKAAPAPATSCRGTRAGPTQESGAPGCTRLTRDVQGPTKADWQSALRVCAPAGSRFLESALGTRVWRGQTAVVLAFVVGWAALWLTFDQRQKLLAEMDYGVSCGQYEGVLAAARQVGTLDHPAKVRLLLALYHTGRLAEELFSFHDMVDDAPLDGMGEDCRAQSQPLFELGLVNDAEHMAHEALEMQGDRPDLLRLLARINLLKGRPQAAQLFLNVLSLIPFQGERANEAWPTLPRQPPLAERAFLDRMRADMFTNDVVHDRLPVAPLLEVLLASQPTNQMAFEYAMAYYLLDLELPKAVARLRSLGRFNYPHIPRPYEEALVLYQEAAGMHVELQGPALRPETVERFRQFAQAVRQSEQTAGGQAALAANFGDTYWYYYYAVRRRQQAAEDQGASP